MVGIVLGRVVGNGQSDNLIFGVAETGVSIDGNRFEFFVQRGVVSGLLCLNELKALIDAGGKRLELALSFSAGSGRGARIEFSAQGV